MWSKLRSFRKLKLCRFELSWQLIDMSAQLKLLGV